MVDGPSGGLGGREQVEGGQLEVRFSCQKPDEV
jgi:hypothetical protein